jgi:wyosine [tRNA(Phe)-imidazoG37] synthetase (radical SAM superfamily)
LEIMLIKGVNDSEESMRAIAKIVRGLRYDRIDLNTPVRPPIPERGALPCDETVLTLAQNIFGPRAHPIGSFHTKRAAQPSRTRTFDDRDKDVREMLMRRPCTAADISSSLGLDPGVVTGILARLTDAGLIESRPGGQGAYYHCVSPHPSVGDE